MSLPTKEKMLIKIRGFVPSSVLLTSADEIQTDMAVPDAWVEMLRQQDAGTQSWLAPWQAYQKLLPGVYEFLHQKVRGICVLLEDQKPPSLLYVYSRGENDYFYRGYPALDRASLEDRRDVWRKLPPHLQNFYSQLHNGWVFLVDDSLGPLPVQDIKFLSDYEWDAEPEDLEKLPFQLDQVIMVFSNGGGDYLALDLSHGAEAAEDYALSWWHEEPLEPHLNFNFWELMDAWICGQVEDIDLAE